MGWSKKHDWRKPIFKVICIDDSNTRLLKKGVRYVLEETETEYQFKSGAANWYSKSRFISGPPKPKPQPKPQPKLNNLF
jgi:hypothetical protein